MQISTTSWHYRLVSSYFSSVSENFCQYFRRLVAAIAVSVFFAFAILSMVVGFGACMYLAVHDPLKFLESGAVIYPGTVVLVLIVSLFNSVFDRYRYRKYEKNSKKYNDWYDARRKAFHAWLKEMEAKGITSIFETDFDAFIKANPQWESPTYKAPSERGVFYQYFKAVKEKTCPLITFK